MAITNVACPHCGNETLVTAPTYTSSVDGTEKMKKIKKVVQNPKYSEMFKTTVHAACRHCNEQFGVLFS